MQPARPKGWFRRSIRWLVHAETGVTFWERAKQIWKTVPEPIRRAATAIANRWIETLVALVWLIGTSVIQFVMDIPFWLTWWMFWFSVLVSITLFQVAGAARQRKAIDARRVAEDATAASKRKAAEGAVKLAEKTRRGKIKRFRRLLPNFPQEQKAILLSLLDEPRELQTTRNPAYELHREGYIRTVHPVDILRNVHLCEISPDFVSSVVELRDRINRTKIQRLAKTITSAQRHALEFFTMPGEEESLPWPDPLSNGMRDLAIAFSELAREHIINVTTIRSGTWSESKNIYVVPDAFSKFISEEILDGKELIRESVTVEWSTIPMSGGSGAGTTPDSKE